MDHTDHAFFTTDHGPDHTDHALFTRDPFKADNMNTKRCRNWPRTDGGELEDNRRWLPGQCLHSGGPGALGQTGYGRHGGQ